MPFVTSLFETLPDSKYRRKKQRSNLEVLVHVKKEQRKSATSVLMSHSKDFAFTRVSKGEVDRRYHPKPIGSAQVPQSGFWVEVPLYTLASGEPSTGALCMYVSRRGVR